MGYDKQTSLPAFKEAPATKDYCRSVVLLTIEKLQPCNDRQIAEFLQWPINCVTGRRGELVTAKKVVLDKKQKDETTNRTVNYWKIRTADYQPVLF